MVILPQLYALWRRLEPTGEADDGREGRTATLLSETKDMLALIFSLTVLAIVSPYVSDIGQELE